ncbi:dihydroneopterin aldolase [Aliiroseovarius sp.]|uniref:dihydroneopterin aldolase n=1 Tax=Aliiroseovarius sp. TaxID=1872442 RepID=UPI002611AD02|nr:dihydroneopterin aldolase [Aliiroseovarius sp.]
MTDETTQAFGPLEGRAAGTAVCDTPPDRISVRDHEVAVEIGAFQAERGVSQRLRFDVVVEVGSHDGADTDDVDDILSYDTITEAITAELAAERLNLLETLADRIAARLLAEPQPLRVFVRIQKLDRGPGKLGVEIVRGRGEVAGAESADVPHPLVVYLGQGDLSGLLDSLADDPRPLIVTVAATGDGPRATTPEAQRHIDLLAMEQAAWALAGAEPRVKVVATRTELDWAMKNGQPVLWAPSKLVLDAVDGPAGTDPVDLTRWIAEELHADELRVEGKA